MINKGWLRDLRGLVAPTMMRSRPPTPLVLPPTRAPLRLPVEERDAAGRVTRTGLTNGHRQRSTRLPRPPGPRGGTGSAGDAGGNARRLFDLRCRCRRDGSRRTTEQLASMLSLSRCSNTRSRSTTERRTAAHEVASNATVAPGASSARLSLTDRRHPPFAEALGRVQVGVRPRRRVEVPEPVAFRRSG